MGFQLTIAQGKEAGREFAFEQPSVVIGRSSECDIVLYDPGVSRRHARIFSEGASFFVEDLGSSNGTQVNGQQVKKQQLEDGDAVTLGPVVFDFVGTELEDPVTGEPEIADLSTRIVSVNAIKRTRGRGEALAPAAADTEELKRMRRSATQTLQAVSKPRSSGQALARNAVAPSRSAPVRASRGRSSGAALSAAERARIKRESSGLMARLKIFWLEATDRTKKLLFAGAGILGLAFLGLIGWLIVRAPSSGPSAGPEPDTLARKPIEASFGLGEGVTFNRPDMKVFEFEYLSPTDAVAIITYQALDISQGEVVVIANGQELAQVPADTLASRDRLLEVVVPAKVLKRGEKNQIIFDNTRNPPGHESWRIWNARVEPIPLPEGTPEQLVMNARKSFDRGVRNLEQLMVGASNGYEAWKNFRNAWLSLEGHPEPKPELYLLARDKMREAQLELDRTCSKLMLEVQTYYNQNNWDAARASLDHVADFFPNPNDQLCPRRAEQKRYELGL